MVCENNIAEGQKQISVKTISHGNGKSSLKRKQILIFIRFSFNIKQFTFRVTCTKMRKMRGKCFPTGIAFAQTISFPRFSILISYFNESPF